MGVGGIVGIIVILGVLFSAISIATDDSPAPFYAKPIHLFSNIADWGIDFFWTGVKFGYTTIGNQEGIDSTDRTLEIHRAFYGLRQDAHIDCCRPAECYIDKICVSQCVDCSTTKQNLEVYYA